MHILQLDPARRSQVQQFLDLPFRLYANCAQWVPPLSTDERQPFDRKNPFYRQSEAAFFLAQDEGRVVGRVAVLDHVPYNVYNQERTAFFTLFECEDNLEAAQGLFQAGAQWAKLRGLECIQGPRGFSLLDGAGLLVRGFEHRPAFGLPYHLPYYAALLEGAGFEVAGETLSGYLHAAAPFPEKIHRAARLIQERRGLRVQGFKSRRALSAFAPRLKTLYNECLAGTSGTFPLNDEDVQAMARQMLWFADPHLVKVVLKGEQPVGFLLAYPDVSAAVQRTRGRVFPLGWARLLLELRRTRWVNVNGMGMAEGYRGLGGTALLFSEMQKSVTRGGYQHADLVQVGVENEAMRREMRDLGVDFYKAHRMYRWDL